MFKFRPNEKGKAAVAFPLALLGVLLAVAIVIVALCLCLFAVSPDFRQAVHDAYYGNYSTATQADLDIAALQKDLTPRLEATIQTMQFGIYKPEGGQIEIESPDFKMKIQHWTKDGKCGHHIGLSIGKASADNMSDDSPCNPQNLWKIWCKIVNNVLDQLNLPAGQLRELKQILDLVDRIVYRYLGM